MTAMTAAVAVADGGHWAVSDGERSQVVYVVYKAYTCDYDSVIIIPMIPVVYNNYRVLYAAAAGAASL